MQIFHQDFLLKRIIIVQRVNAINSGHPRVLLTNILPVLQKHNMKKVQRITDGCQQYEKQTHPLLTQSSQFLMEKVG